MSSINNSFRTVSAVDPNDLSPFLWESNILENINLLNQKILIFLILISMCYNALINYYDYHRRSSDPRRGVLITNKKRTTKQKTEELASRNVSLHRWTT